MVSVILPFYNPGVQLERAIASVLAQRQVVLELLLVNNNATDASSALAQSYAHRYPDKVFVLHEPKQGVVHAMNCGLQQARYSWIARMDADDEWLHDKLKLQLSFAEQHPHLKVIGTQVKFSSALTHVDGFRAYVSWSNGITSQQQIDRSIFTESPLVNPSILFRKELIDLHGLYKEGSFPEDYEMFLRWHAQGVPMAKVAKQLMVWNDSSERLTRTHEAYLPEAFNRVKCQYLALWLKKNSPFKEHIWVWGAGRKTRKKLEVLEAEGIQIDGFIDLKANRTYTKPCISFKDLKKEGTPFIVSFVSNRGKGEEIRQYLQAKSFNEFEHFVIAG